MSSAASNAPTTNTVRWVKSSHSGPTGGNCVEVAALSGGQVAIRDSWYPAGPALVFPACRWTAFTRMWRAPAPMH
jgi:hypothetical protein